MSLAPAWLSAHPIAHRGLHDVAQGRVENSLSAARAAMARGFGIECDVQLSGDGEAMVFHDFTLERLTQGQGRVDAMPAERLCDLCLRGGHDRVATLAEFCALVAGRVPITVEIKSRFDGDLRLAERVAQVVADYAGPLCLESFDPFVMAHLRQHRQHLRLAHVPLGMIAQAHYDDPLDEWAHLSSEERRSLAQFLHFEATQPEFLSFCVGDLPHAVAHLCRKGLGLPVTVWTVRSAAECELALKWGDQIVFEGIDP